MKISIKAEDALFRLREKRPLVHCITNYVTAGDTANMLLAAGASPIMADDPNETAEVALAADAAVLNMGTLSEKRLAAMIAAGKSANEKGIAVVLDPVGVQLTEFRRRAAEKIFSEVKISIVRGNISELSFLAGIADSAETHGVDSCGGMPEKAAKAAAEKLGCVCAATGKTDVITDGKTVFAVKNGCGELKRITGAGCMTTALCGAFSAVTEPLYAALFGTAFMGICGELALEKCGENAMGSFHTAVFDAASMDGKKFSERLKSDEI